MFQIKELVAIVSSTTNPAIAVDLTGAIVACNAAAEKFFGLAFKEMKGRFCGEVVRGSDDSGFVCSIECEILEHLRFGTPGSCKDLHVCAKSGKQWCVITSLLLPSSSGRYAVHVIHPNDVSKRLELLFQEYRGSGVLASRSEEESAQYEKLTRREAQILRMLAQAATSRNIAAALGISIATTNNHIQHILQKLKAHSRLQAVQKAQKARLI